MKWIAAGVSRCAWPAASTAARLVGGQFGDDLIDTFGRYPEQPQIGLAEFENEINGARHRCRASRLINDRQRVDARRRADAGEEQRRPADDADKQRLRNGAQELPRHQIMRLDYRRRELAALVELIALLIVGRLEGGEESIEIAHLGAPLAMGQPHRSGAASAPETLSRGHKLLPQEFAAVNGPRAVTLQGQ